MITPRPDVNIFLVHSRFQLLIVQHMLATMPELQERENCLVLDMSDRELPIERSRWSRVLQLDPPVGGTVRGRSAVCRSAVRSVHAIAMPYRRVSLFVSDIQWPLNNALYGSLVRGAEAPGATVELCSFPDGIGSLLIVYPNAWQRAKNVAKDVLGRLGGTPYYRYGGDIMGLELSYRIYSLLPEAIAPLQDRCVKIPTIARQAGELEKETCLFLGQSYERYLSRSQLHDLSESAARYARDLGYRHLLYKPHPREQASEMACTFRRHGFDILEDPRTAEELCLERPVACTVSYNCSALVHLKLMYGGSMRCISIFSNRMLAALNVERAAAAKMRAVFALSGVEWYE
jgi:hypothetical protein